MLLAYTGSCPVPAEGQSSTCQDVFHHYQTEPENPTTVAHLEAVQFLAYRSIDLMAPLYLFLMAIGVFRRYIIARI